MKKKLALCLFCIAAVFILFGMMTSDIQIEPYAAKLVSKPYHAGPPTGKNWAKGLTPAMKEAKAQLMGGNRGERNKAMMAQ